MTQTQNITITYLMEPPAFSKTKVEELTIYIYIYIIFFARFFILKGNLKAICLRKSLLVTSLGKIQHPICSLHAISSDDYLEDHTRGVVGILANPPT